LDRLQSEEEMISMPFEKCPVCGGDLVEKEAEKILRGG
jgi:ssDNA-binding Zn-finger/Zn-ribbon topoisomerase 1